MSAEYIQRPGSSPYTPSSDEPLVTVNHTNFSKLMSLKAFDGSPRIALAGFKKRWKETLWMQRQYDYRELACLAAASGEPSNLRVCSCGSRYVDDRGRSRLIICKQMSVCPSCNFHYRVAQCKRELLPAFGRANYWYALTPGWQSSPLKAGLHWVTRQDENGAALEFRHWRPFADRPDAPFTHRYSVDHAAEMHLMAELPFKFAAQLCKHGFLDGLYCMFEWHFSFYPGDDGNCFHTALPHAHIIANREKPLTFQDGVEIQKLYQRTCARNLGTEQLPAYPDLAIAPIRSEERLAGWINYSVKPMALVDMYRRGIQRGCSVTTLNVEFHQTVWHVINLVRSPRKLGNLYVLNKDDYIGEQQFRKLPKAEYARLIERARRGQTLTDKEELQLERHELACDQQRESWHRRATARVPGPDIDLGAE